MKKELEALRILKANAILFDDGTDFGASMLEAISDLDKSLTPPTADEVCEALSDELGKKILYDKNIQLSEVISMQQPEQRLGKRIQLYCGRINWLCIRYNTGKVQDAKTGKWIDFGPPTGHSDYIIYTDDGRAIFIETKIHPRKPTKEQLDWLDEMRSRGFGAYVIYSLEEFITTVVGGKEVGK